MKEAGKDYLDYVQDILDAAKDAEEFTKGLSLAEFKKDRKTVFAATRALEIIGEATKSLPQNAYEQIPRDTLERHGRDEGQAHTRILRRRLGSPLEDHTERHTGTKKAYRKSNAGPGTEEISTVPPPEHLRRPRPNPKKGDYYQEYYINNQVIPAVLRILEPQRGTQSRN